VAPMFWREMFLTSSNFDWIGYWEKKTENPHTVFVIYFMIPMYIYIAWHIMIYRDISYS
jgi:hypothetical protein